MHEVLNRIRATLVAYLQHLMRQQYFLSKYETRYFQRSILRVYPVSQPIFVTCITQKYPVSPNQSRSL
jgi:hypothetical protein